MLLVAWWQHRDVPALALWGLGNFVDTSGIFCLMVGPVLQRPVLIMLADGLVALGPGLIWKAARSLDGKPAPWSHRRARGRGGGTGERVTDDAERDQHAVFHVERHLPVCGLLLPVDLPSRAARRPLAAHRPDRAGRGRFVGRERYAYLRGAIDQNTVPTVLSLSGLIHFESMLFLLGTAVFLLAFVKEREETASRIAASTDPLTGIANRGGFMLRAERVVERCRRDGSPVSVLMFDLDRFKEINDTFGHAVGDTVLLKFCEVASGALRANDVFGRIGGEEFAVVFPGSGIEAAWARADRIRVSFMETCRKVGEFQVDATVSGGVATSAAPRRSLDTLLASADVALYNAKTEGRNRIKRSNDPSSETGEPGVIRVA